MSFESFATIYAKTVNAAQSAQPNRKQVGGKDVQQSSGAKTPTAQGSNVRDEPLNGYKAEQNHEQLEKMRKRLAAMDNEDSNSGAKTPPTEQNSNVGDEFLNDYKSEPDKTHEVLGKMRQLLSAVDKTHEHNDDEITEVLKTVGDVMRARKLTVAEIGAFVNLLLLFAKIDGIDVKVAEHAMCIVGDIVRNGGCTPGQNAAFAQHLLGFANNNVGLSDAVIQLVLSNFMYIVSNVEVTTAQKESLAEELLKLIESHKSRPDIVQYGLNGLNHIVKSGGLTASQKQKLHNQLVGLLDIQGLTSVVSDHVRATAEILANSIKSHAN